MACCKCLSVGCTLYWWWVVCLKNERKEVRSDNNKGNEKEVSVCGERKESRKEVGLCVKCG